METVSGMEKKKKRKESSLLLNLHGSVERYAMRDQRKLGGKIFDDEILLCFKNGLIFSNKPWNKQQNSR